MLDIFFLIIVIFSYEFFNFVFGSFLFCRAIDKEVSSRHVFSFFVVMHVCFITICFYLQGSNFVCCYACFLLNNSYFFLLIFQLCFWFLFLFSLAIDEEASSRKILFPFAVMHAW